MSKKQEFIDATTATIYTNGQEKVTAQGVQDLLNDTLSPNVVWTDNQLAGFGSRWELIDDTVSVPSTGQFSVNELIVAGTDEMKIHKNSIGISFNDSINKISNIIISNNDGDRFVFEVYQMDTFSSYVTLYGTPATGTLTTLELDTEYYISFMYGVDEVDIATIYVINETEFLAAVTNINTNFVGGNIILGANIDMTQNWNIDLTNIDIYGFNYVIWNGANDIGSDLGYTITEPSGSPSWNNVHFAGSETRGITIQMSGQSSRQLFDFGTTSSYSRSINFNNCLFNDIVGGAGTNDVMTATSVSGGKTLTVSFNNCTTNAHNNSVPFSYNGFTLNCTTTTSFFVVNVFNQKPSVSPTSLNNSELGFEISSSTSAQTNFNTDGTAYLVTGSDATNEKYLNLAGIPTSDPLQVGAVWSNSGILTISAG